VASEKASLIYVCSNIPADTANQVCVKLITELTADIKPVNTIQEVFPKFSDPQYRVDFVCICIDDLYGVKSADAFDLLKTLSTLINCTVCREKSGSKPVKRQTKIVIVVGDDADPKLIKELILMPEIDYFTHKLGGKFGYNEIKAGMENFLNAGDRVPKDIVDLIRAKKNNI
jgi:hypothetical protein